MCADGTDRSDWPTPQFDDEDGLVVRRTAEELESKAKLARTFAYGLMSIGVIALVTLAGAALYQGAQVRTLVKTAVAEQERVSDDAEREAILIGQIMTCLLGQFAEHRDSTRSFNQAVAERLGVHESYHPVGRPTEHDPAKTQAACDASVAALNQPPPPPEKEKQGD